MAVFPSMEGAFFTRMWDGLKREASGAGVAIELQVPRDRIDLKRGMVELLEIARISEVVGVLLYVTHGSELTREILFLYPEVNTIFCTSPVDTVAAYRSVAEFRRDRDVWIIGYGYNKEIERGLKNGSIYATLVRNPEAIGSQAVQTLLQLSNNRYVSSFIYLPSEVRWGRRMRER